MPRRPPSPAGTDEAHRHQIVRDRLLPLRRVIELCGIRKTTIYRLIRQGRFPKAYKPGGHASRWSERELSAWLAEIAAQRE
jgi:prophage regulatory protein